MRTSYVQQQEQDKLSGEGKRLHLVEWANSRDREKDILDGESF